MGRDKVIGIILVGLSVAAAPGIGLIAIREGRLQLVTLAGPAVVFLLGLLFFFTNFLETSLGVKDELEELPKLLEDDVDALFSRRFTWTHFMVASTILAAISLLVALLWYRKWAASWGPVNVFVASAMMVAVTLFVGIRHPWFQRRDRRISRRAFLIPLVGLILSVGLGLYATEPKELGGRTRSGGFLTEADLSSSRRAGGADFLGFIIDGGADLDIDCDGEECLLLLLVVIVIVCVVSSACIPHFWVLAGHWLLTIMALMALRELLVSEQAKST